jgi:excisionase family DNA binding protein
VKTAKALSPGDKLVFNVGELAEVLGIGLPAARNMIHIEGFPALKVGGRYLIPKQALQRWLDNRANNNQDDRIQVRNFG